MKVIILGSLFALFISSCLAQKTGRNLYAEALSACVHKAAKDYSKIAVEHDLKDRIVDYDFKITSDLPKQFGEIKVEYLSPGDIIERYKKNCKEVNVLTLDVMKSDGTNLRINIGERWISYEGSALIGTVQL